MNFYGRKTNLKVRTSFLREQEKRWTFCQISATKIAISVIAVITTLCAWSLKTDLQDLLLTSDIPPSRSTSLPPRYVTVVLPSVVNPTRRRNRLEAIAQTWGPAARAIYVLHDKDEYSGNGNSANLGDTTQPYPHKMVLPESINVKDGIARLQYVLQAILENYDPDFTFFVNDHTYVLPNHACKFLRNRSPEEHMYAGHALSNDKKVTFNSGAAGYFLSRASLRGLTERWVRSSGAGTDDVHCSVGTGGGSVSNWLQGNPGLVTAECLGLSMGVNPVDTRDEIGRHLFHAFGLVRTVKGSVDQWYLKKHKKLDDVFGEDILYHHQPKKSKDCCSLDTISFHYVESAETVALTETLKKIMVNNKSASLTDDDLKIFMQNIWPKNAREIGGYAQGLPPVTQSSTWNDLLFVVKNIAQGVVDTPCLINGD